MKACGLIVEYNPLHNGHVYHINKAKKISGADCMIAVMSGSFLQRGEPAIVDKFTRAKMALETGIDIVIELPFAYAVQSSELFAKGAIQTLSEIGASSICFGSESGHINDFITAYEILTEKASIYTEKLKKHLDQGEAYPRSTTLAYEEIGLTSSQIDLSKPNNILGFSYVKEILSNNLSLTPLTLKRIHNDYHDSIIKNTITSATSIRQELLQQAQLTTKLIKSMPETSTQQLLKYKTMTSIWHTWENYFPLLHYRISTMSHIELRAINGVIEGLEYRIKDKIKQALSFKDLIEAVKTKRYTWTRLQRIFVHILTNTKKTDLLNLGDNPTVPYIRPLALSKKGRGFLKQQKKEINVPIYSQLTRNQDPLLVIEERASDAYYSILPIKTLKKLRRQELAPPLLS